MTASSTEFWAETQIAGPFATLKESEESLRARAEAFPVLEELMPTSQSGKVVLDYGCGPGHDTILLAKSGAFVNYADISKLALDITQARLELHGLNGWRWWVLNQNAPSLPYVDHIHCAGVLHHCANPMAVLHAFNVSLRPQGDCRVMVYDGDRSEHTQSDVPITRWWTEDQVKGMASRAGFHAYYTGSYECSAPWRPNCMAACYLLR